MLRWVWVDWNDSFLTHFFKLRTNPPSTACFLQICLNQGPEDSQMCRKMLATYIGTGALLCQDRWTLHNKYVDWLDLARLTILLGPRPLLDETGVCQRFNLKFSRWTKVFPKQLSRSTPRRPELYHTRESASHLVLSLSHMGLSGTWLLQNPINGSCLTIANILAMLVKLYTYIYIHLFHAIPPWYPPLKCVVLPIRHIHFVLLCMCPGTAAFVLESMPDFQERPARCLAAQPQGFHGGCEKCRNGGFTHYITMICPLYDHFSCELLLFVKFFGTLWSGNVAVVIWAARGQELFSSGQTLTVEACEPVPVSGIFGAIPMNAYKLSNRNQIWNIDVEWWCYIMYVYIYIS